MTQGSPFGETVKEIGTVLLAVMCLGGTILLAVAGKPIPDILLFADVAILGFFFGQASMNGTRTRSIATAAKVEQVDHARREHDRATAETVAKLTQALKDRDLLPKDADLCWG